MCLWVCCGDIDSHPNILDEWMLQAAKEREKVLRDILKSITRMAPVAAGSIYMI